MQSVFVNVIDGKLIFSEEQVHHLADVVRLNKGEHFQAIGDGICYDLMFISSNPFKYEITSKKEIISNQINVTLFYCLPKGEKLELVIQKATELGVKEIVIVESSRCIAKIKKEDVEKKLKRFQKIALEASQQSKRTSVPTINKIIKYSEIKNYHFDYQFIAYENEGNSSFLKSLLDIPSDKSISILIGSEGGFSLQEVEYAKENGYNSISLGPRILRSETAAIYALSVIGATLER